MVRGSPLSFRGLRMLAPEFKRKLITVSPGFHSGQKLSIYLR
ncbi:hypothetical protein FOCG_13975 [Fusarium oxysporum f. sp. radicis-lycopersici 26381]|uniref:Uncharacterized protein n=1 Tax=Fusarium oxysporum Fo47 TaxID=660027 RepID=W9L475_FUSOX|nr:hypothetical protein FOZG_01588 [Fusarium oxysporum Fo47]EWZ90992.1 hypothetical protein FOWG_06744 [Fusarium oxysporum f. sp. lycopersici MN25]EXL43574.1 hypothetical protein FOCG_13975 [Fusarium oxysporum f. sp. radicis-lycopersici 26381]